jgi:hypothetical protein
MYNILYDYVINDVVWTLIDSEARECVVIQITLEIDPAFPGGEKEKQTYHLHPIETEGFDSLCEGFEVVLRSPEELFRSMDDILDYINDPPSYVYPPPTKVIEYEFAIGETLWTVDDDAILLSDLIQTVFDIDPSDEFGQIERTLYYVLPRSMDYSMVVRMEYELFRDYDDAVDYVIEKKKLTPTPTNTPTPTPTAYVTPTPTPSPYPIGIQSEDFDLILDENGDVLLED